MDQPPEMRFDGSKVARSYDDGLVPVLFEPWARRMLDEHGPWEGRHVLDLATGTGVVARHLAERVAPGGRVIAADLNEEMLAIARERCADVAEIVRVEAMPADALTLESDSVDVVVCQQGFQFFPDRAAAAREASRVLRGGGRFVLTTWLPVESCEFFGAICETLEALGLPDVSRKMRVPFDHVPAGELTTHLAAAGFAGVDEREQDAPIVFDGGVEHAVKTAWATPIGPDLVALPESGRAEFNRALAERLDALSSDGATMGRMRTRLATAVKPDA
ncbi:MAG: class I SAM-dependent methyltransferase [Planctomycetota bacterium]|jgi:ubiquinone/menaquinone biosynthesis C-methylase UbiE